MLARGWGWSGGFGCCCYWYLRRDFGGGALAGEEMCGRKRSCRLRVVVGGILGIWEVVVVVAVGFAGFGVPSLAVVGPGLGIALGAVAAMLLGNTHRQHPAAAATP